MIQKKIPRNSSRGSNSSSRSRSRSRSHSPGFKTTSRIDPKQSNKRDSKKRNNEDSKNLGPIEGLNPNEKFVWNKKIEELKKKGIDNKELEEEEKRKQAILLEEIEKVRKRKLERERQKKTYDKEKVTNQEFAEEESFKRWLDKEEQFHIEQAKLRSEIRIQQGREQPVDYLANLTMIQAKNIDVEYWENVLKTVKVRKAKAFLEEMGSRFLEEYKKDNSDAHKKALCSVNINSGDLSPRLLDFEKKFENLLITPAEDVEALNEERGNILVT